MFVFSGPVRVCRRIHNLMLESFGIKCRIILANANDPNGLVWNVHIQYPHDFRIAIRAIDRFLKENRS